MMINNFALATFGDLSMWLSQLCFSSSVHQSELINDFSISLL